MSSIRTSLLTRPRVAAITTAAMIGATMVVGAAGASAATNPPTFGPQVGLGSGFSQPYDVSVDAAGDIFVADNGTHTIDKITANGATTTQIATIANNDQTFAIANDSAGNVYWADWQNGNVYKLSATDNTTSIAVTGLTGAHALTFDKNDNMYIGAGGSVYEKAAGSSGETAELFANGFELVTGLVADASGNIYVADGSNDNNDVTEVTVSPRGFIHLQITGLNNPAGLAMDANGDLFIAGGGGNNVVMFTPGGVQSTVGSGYVSPEGVAVNSAGDVIVADTYNPRVVSNPSVDPQTITLTSSIPTTAATGTTLGVSATGGGSGNPVVFSVDTVSSYPADTCKIVPGGKRVQFTKTGTCVLNIDQAAAPGYLPGHLAEEILVKPTGLRKIVLSAPDAPSLTAPITISAEGFDKSGNDLGDVTAITNLSSSNGSCSLGQCFAQNAGPTVITGTEGTITAKLRFSVPLFAGLFDTSYNPITTLTGTVGQPLAAFLGAFGAPSGSFKVTHTGALPSGVTFSPTSFILSGTPKRAGTFALTYKFADSVTASINASVTFTIVIS